MTAVPVRITPRDAEIPWLIMDGYSARLIGEQILTAISPLSSME
jgi:hypothetical protein